MIVFLKKYSAIYCSVFMLGYYIFLSWILHRTGYEHSEAMFVAEKVKLFFEAHDNTLLTIGTTFPTVIFLSSVIFVPFGYPYAPVLASISFTVLLIFFLLNDFQQSKLPRRVYIPMIAILFIFHPGLIYSAISGRGVAAVLFFVYMVFRSIFKFYAHNTTYYLSVSSIFLSFLIFCEYNFVWMLLAFFPFIFLVALDGLKHVKEQPVVIQFFEAINLTSLRRKLVDRTVAIYLMVFLLPITVLFIYKLLNYVHAGNQNYFLTSQYANWHVVGSEYIGNIIKTGATDSVNFQSQVIFQFYVLALTPMLVLTFLIFKGKMYEFFTLIVPFILLAILLLDNQTFITIEYYLILLIIALVGIYYYAGKRFNVKYLYPVVIIVAVLNVFTGIYYFKHTGDSEERIFYDAFLKMKKLDYDKKTSEEYDLAAYISNIVDDTHKILMDDAAAFRIMAHLRSLKPVVMPVDNHYITVSENPKLGVKYICIAKAANPLRNFTVWNDYDYKQMQLRQKFQSVIMYETENWAIYKVL
jgi:hypothetical protein